jgi:hypothetical protein
MEPTTTVMEEWWKRCRKVTCLEDLRSRKNLRRRAGDGRVEGGGWRVEDGGWRG